MLPTVRNVAIITYDLELCRPLRPNSQDRPIRRPCSAIAGTEGGPDFTDDGHRWTTRAGPRPRLPLPRSLDGPNES